MIHAYFNEAMSQVNNLILHIKEVKKNNKLSTKLPKGKKQKIL